MAASSTSFVIVEPLGASSSSTESETDGRMVRFDTECVLIPDPSSSSRRGPRVITKSYSLPLWKRRPAASPSAGASDSESTDDPSTAPFLSSSPETHVVLRVPIPSFVRRPSRSPGPSRGAYSGRSLSSSPTIPLSPCLVHRPTTTLPSSPTAESPQRLLSPTSPTLRRPALPIYQRRQDEQTVPLRACCPDCVPITDQCLREGSLWKEKFTRGARRLRSASLDSSTTSSSGISIGGPQKAAFVPGSFDEKMPPPTFAITVDEVDKRRRSQDNSSAAAVAVVGGGTPRSGSTFQHHSTSFNIHNNDRDHSADSSSDVDVITDSPSLIPPPHLVPRKASPIAEENEDELFPLPSPRRSPTGSSSSSTRSSPRPSPRTSPGVSPKISPGPSPNTSSSCLHPNDAIVLAVALKAKTKSRSKESVSSEELLANCSGTAGISRKKENNGIIDTPPQSGASTPRARPSLTLPFPIPAPSSRTSLTNPNGGGDTAPNSPISALSTSLTSISSSTSSSQTHKSPITPTSTSPRIPIPSPPSLSSLSLSSPKSSSAPPPPSSSLSALGSSGPKGSSSPNLTRLGGSKSRKMSFGKPFLKAGEAIRGASVDVLRGVSSISGGPSGGGGVGIHMG